MAESENCSKCGCGLDTKGSPKWCRQCRAAYKREYEDTRESMSVTVGYGKGVDDFRAMLAIEFDRIGKAVLSGREVAFAIRNAPRPTYLP